MKIDEPVQGIAADAERVLRTLPRWFGIEPSLLEYARDTERHPTFAAMDGDQVIAFLTVREHFSQAWEIHCLAVQSTFRSRGVGRQLHQYAERWLAARDVRLLQVKTVAAAHPSPEYAETRAFYLAMGYCELEVFPQLWGPGLPVLQLVKVLQDAA